MNEFVSFWSIPIGTRIYIQTYPILLRLIGAPDPICCVKTGRFTVNEMELDERTVLILSPFKKAQILQSGQWRPGGKITSWNTLKECKVYLRSITRSSQS